MIILVEYELKTSRLKSMNLQIKHQIVSLKNLYYKLQFEPGFLGLFVNPFYFARKGVYDGIKEVAPELNGKILDVGCGNMPYKRLFNSTEYMGIEIDSHENRERNIADYFFDGITLPFDNCEFDSVITSQVFEHVFEPNNFLAEVNRVLKPGGKLLLTVPFVWDEHEQPNDYARYSSFGIRYILKKNKFEVLVLKKMQADLSLFFQLLNSYIFKLTNSRSRYLNFMITILFMSPVNVLGVFVSKITPGNQDLYLNNVVLAKKVK